MSCCGTNRIILCCKLAQRLYIIIKTDITIIWPPLTISYRYYAFLIIYLLQSIISPSSHDPDQIHFVVPSSLLNCLISLFVCWMMERLWESFRSYNFSLIYDDPEKEEAYIRFKENRYTAWYYRGVIVSQITKLYSF